MDSRKWFTTLFTEISAPDPCLWEVYVNTLFTANGPTATVTTALSYFSQWVCRYLSALIIIHSGSNEICRVIYYSYMRSVSWLRSQYGSPGFLKAMIVGQALLLVQDENKPIPYLGCLHSVRSRFVLSKSSQSPNKFSLIGDQKMARSLLNM